MILRDKTFIDRMPEEVWYFIEDPLRMRSWNLRIREIVPASIGERGEGFTYRARYEIGGKESNFEAEIMEYRRPFRFVLHLAGGSLRRGGYIQEIYELSESGGGTLLQHTVEAHGSGMGISPRLLVMSIHRLARPAGRKYLLSLKKLVETSPGDPETP
jgi:carbon monoxide dehydrogenase subunit G